MRKSIYFDVFDGPGWPMPGDLKPYFLAPSSFESGNDCWGLTAEGVDGTEHLQVGKGRIDIRLTMVGNLYHGVLLCYHKWGGSYKDTYYSRGDLGRLREWIKTKDGDLMPIGLHIPFEIAWEAVKEFIERDGALPNNIAWIADADIPADAFPDPGERRIAEE